MVIYALFFCMAGSCTAVDGAAGTTFSSLRSCIAHKAYVERVTTYSHAGLVCMKKVVPAWTPAQ